MFIRCAFFRGHVRPGFEEAFTSFVRDKLAPLWTQFPGAEEVRVMRQEEADVAEPHFEMALAIRYPSKRAIELALASDVRTESRATTADLVKMFDGEIFHTVFRADEFPLAIV
jgi:hypothetical protein